MPTLFALQHISCEPPAAYEDELRARGHDLVRVELDEGDALPDWPGFRRCDRDGLPDGRLRRRNPSSSGPTSAAHTCRGRRSRVRRIAAALPDAPMAQRHLRAAGGRDTPRELARVPAPSLRDPPRLRAAVPP